MARKPLAVMAMIIAAGLASCMRVPYSGGCGDHGFRLRKVPPDAVDPPPVELG